MRDLHLLAQTLSSDLWMVPVAWTISLKRAMVNVVRWLRKRAHAGAKDKVRGFKSIVRGMAKGASAFHYENLAWPAQRCKDAFLYHVHKPSCEHSRTPRLSSGLGRWRWRRLVDLTPDWLPDVASNSALPSPMKPQLLWLRKQIESRKSFFIVFGTKMRRNSKRNVFSCLVTLFSFFFLKKFCHFDTKAPFHCEFLRSHSSQPSRVIERMKEPCWLIRSFSLKHIVVT